MVENIHIQHILTRRNVDGFALQACKCIITATLTGKWKTYSGIVVPTTSSLGMKQLLNNPNSLSLYTQFTE